MILKCSFLYNKAQRCKQINKTSKNCGVILLLRMSFGLDYDCMLTLSICCRLSFSFKIKDRAVKNYHNFLSVVQSEEKQVTQFKS